MEDVSRNDAPSRGPGTSALPSPTIARVITQIPDVTPTEATRPAITTAPTVPDQVVPTPTPTVVPVVDAKISTPTATATQQETPGPRANTRLFRHEAEAIQLAGSQGLIKNAETIQLAKQVDGSYAKTGVLLSEQQMAEFAFSHAVISWNAETPAGTRLEFQLRVGNGDGTSPWFTMGTWGPSGGASLGGQSNAWGSVDVDTLNLPKHATMFQYKVTFATDDSAASPRLRSLAVVYSDMKAPLTGPKPSLLAGWARDLPVPQYSQLEQDPSVARAICSPTSLTMVLNYWGKRTSVPEAYQAVRDARSGIFGNWPLNVAYAGILDFDAYVDRFYSVEQLQNEIAQGRPTIISIRFGPGQLDNSPINSTTGHLIVVRGFTPQGDVIVNDPIAPNSSGVRRIYKRAQLAKIWQDSGGIVYVIRPRQQTTS